VRLPYTPQRRQAPRLGDLVEFFILVVLRREIGRHSRTLARRRLIANRARHSRAAAFAAYRIPVGPAWVLLADPELILTLSALQHLRRPNNDPLLVFRLDAHFLECNFQRAFFIWCPDGTEESALCTDFDNFPILACLLIGHI
jgi:hypothetical protein